jgi:hypothetical protein
MKFYTHFYTTWSYQIEVLPRITIMYKNEVKKRRFILLSFAIEWLWFGLFFGNK